MMILPLKNIQKIISEASHILIVQADNPDADSLGSALAIEDILEELGKKTTLICAVDIPTYLQYIQGWDRVQKDVPLSFYESLIVDASTVTLFERLESSGELSWIASKPCIVLDHHESVEKVISFAEVLHNDPTQSSTGELIYRLANEAGWPLTLQAQANCLTAILGDTQGLSNQLATPATYRVVADMLEAGVDRTKLEEARREYGKMPQKIFRYKAKLIDRCEFTNNDRVASVIIPQAEINTFSPLYNPAPLIQNDLLQISGVAVAIVFKQYDDGRTTAAIRCNQGYPIGAELAKAMGGGGHAYASGFKDVSGRSFDEVKADCLKNAGELLESLGNNQ